MLPRLRGVERQRKNPVGRLGLLEDEGDVGVVAEALNGLVAERRQLEGERVQVLARRAAWEAHRKAGERLALEALGVHVVVGKASDTPRYVIRMEIEGPPMADGSSATGMAGQGPASGPLVLRWTDADDLEGLVAA